MGQAVGHTLKQSRNSKYTTYTNAHGHAPHAHCVCMQCNAPNNAYTHAHADPITDKCVRLAIYKSAIAPITASLFSK